MKNMTTAIIAASLVASGCAANRPYLAPDGVYWMDYTSILCAAASADFVREEARGKAIKFCAAKGKATEVIHAVGEGGIPFLQCARASIGFRCAENDET